MTPRQLSLAFKAYEKQTIREQNHGIELAWLTSKLSLCDPQKFPKIETLLIRERSAKKQTKEEMIAILRGIAAAHEGMEAQKNG